MTLTVMTNEQFDNLFKTKRVDDLWYCYGTWNGIDFSHEAGRKEDSRIEMWQILVQLGFIIPTRTYSTKTRFQLLSTSVKNSNTQPYDNGKVVTSF